MMARLLSHTLQGHRPRGVTALLHGRIINQESVPKTGPQASVKKAVFLNEVTLFPGSPTLYQVDKNLSSLSSE